MHREFQSDLREQLKRQTDTHNQHLTDALNTQVLCNKCVCVCVCWIQ